MTMTEGQANLPRILTLAEAAKFLRFSKSHLSNVLNGKVQGIPPLPTVRVGRRVVFRRESLEEWLRDVESAELVAVGEER
jgi:excisionase family DNA binding protein